MRERVAIVLLAILMLISALCWVAQLVGPLD